jgi:hypothetical protein
VVSSNHKEIRMGRTHGEADRLMPADQIDMAAFDAAVMNGGQGEEGARLAMVNTALGPRRFGRMFPDLPPFRPPDDALTNLGLAMLDPLPQAPAGDSLIPAGFTYLGQFIDHDLSLDPTAGFPIIDDPNTIQDGRTPAFDLDSVYGLGPVRQPELYDPSFIPGRAHFKIGLTSSVSVSGGQGQPDVPVSLPNDLPRHPDRTAILPDGRNDENLLVAQTHLALLKFHNRVIDSLPQGAEDKDPTAVFSKAEEDSKASAFHRASRLVRWHYQWIVLHDFLPRLVDPEVLADVLEHGRRFLEFDDAPFMPVEFSVAGYRLGHTMVREAYNFNRVFNGNGPPALTIATFRLLFAFTGKGGFLPPDVHASLPSNWIIDWRRFHDVGRPDLVNFARRIDTKITGQLHSLPIPGVAATPPPSLPVRNLLRGSRVGLPKGQDVARAMELLKPLTPDEIAGGSDGPIVRAHGFHEETPLWYYILKEAEVRGGGQRLGDVGSRIVSEVFVGLLDGDRNSFRAKQPHWTPTLPAATPGTFTMADLLRLVADLNPLGPGPEGP